MSPVAHHRGCASIRVCVDKLDVDTGKLVVTVPATKCEITWQVVYRISVLECTYEGILFYVCMHRMGTGELFDWLQSTSCWSPLGLYQLYEGVYV